jgi:hypothetical protein
LHVPIEGVVFRVVYISVRRNVVLENEWNVECEWLPSQIVLEFARMSFMISRRLVVPVAACLSCSVLGGEFSGFFGLVVTGRLIVGFFRLVVTGRFIVD